MEFICISWNLLAPSLQAAETRTTRDWNTRSRDICDWLLAQRPQIISLSEVDEFGEGKYQIDFFAKHFPLESYAHIYLPKATSVARSISARHGNLVIIDRRFFEVAACFMIPLGQAEAENQIAACILLHCPVVRQNLILVSLHLKAGDSELAQEYRASHLAKITEIVYNQVAPRFAPTLIYMGDFNQHNLKIDNFHSIYEFCKPTNSQEIPCARTQAIVNIASPDKKDSKENNERLDYIFWHTTNNAKGKPYCHLKTLKTFNASYFEKKNLSDYFPIRCVFELSTDHL